MLHNSFSVYQRSSMNNPNLPSHNVYLYYTPEKLTNDLGAFRIDIDPTLCEIIINVRKPGRSVIESPICSSIYLQYADEDKPTLESDDMSERVFDKYAITADEIIAFVQDAKKRDSGKQLNNEPTRTELGIPMTDAELIEMMNKI